MRGPGSLNHNRRSFTAENVDPERSSLNVVYRDEPIQKVYHELFDEAVNRYNAKQKRRDRCITDYYEHLRTGKQEKLFHELIVKIGKKEDIGILTENGALVDLSGHLGGWVSIIGYVFSLLALATSFWANTLNLRDIVNEQTKWGEKISWLAATLPCLVIALVGVQSFVGFTRMASVVQVLTGVGVIVAYNRSRKRAGTSLICGRLGSLPFQILAVAASLVASVGAVLTVTV